VPTHEIDDAADPRLADFVGLRDADLRRRFEDARGIFIAEGITVVRRLLASPYAVRTVLVTAPLRERLRDALTDDVEVVVTTRSVMAEVAGFDLHRGAVASADRLPPADLEAALAGARTVAVLEGLNDAENLGAIARSARALGVDALLLDPTCADPLYRRTVRVSMGEILFLRLVRTGPVAELVPTLHAHGYEVLALTPAHDATDLRQISRAPGDKLALVLGAEGPGLSDAALRAADRRVRIALAHDVDSLNVGHAAAIAFDRLAARH
jgi:tRNA G18 (ribose-2'-O)-methylase SpoU